MIVAVGCDHAGYALKARIFRAIEEAGYEVLDCGAYAPDPDDDYPDYARAVGEALIDGRAQRGVLLCGSGVGVAIAACKIPDVRAAMAHDTFSARQGVEDDEMNVITIGARVIGPELAAEVVNAFLAARFSGDERHVRRSAKIDAIERDARDGAFDRPRHDGADA
ncbi:MAG TPA: RpiB/LacA/LacB family sugar-phosphate isomerase [Gemmatimonadota bacterium]|nr:RpiB/LacA/LacB family sugar-phosphate isomerase [Gemmatimonadota bacterium]